MKTIASAMSNFLMGVTKAKCLSYSLYSSNRFLGSLTMIYWFFAGKTSALYSHLKKNGRPMSDASAALEEITSKALSVEKIRCLICRNENRSV